MSSVRWLLNRHLLPSIVLQRGHSQSPQLGIRENTIFLGDLPSVTNGFAPPVQSAGQLVPANSIIRATRSTRIPAHDKMRARFLDYAEAQA